MNKKTNKFNDLTNFIYHPPPKKSFFFKGRKRLCLIKPWKFDSIVRTAGDLAKFFRRFSQREGQICKIMEILIFYKT